MTRYVERDGKGRIVGVYANRQPGRAEKDVAGDDAEVMAFEQPPAPTEVERAEAEIGASPFARGLIRVLAKRLGATPAGLVAEIKAEVA